MKKPLSTPRYFSLIFILSLFCCFVQADGYAKTADVTLEEIGRKIQSQKIEGLPLQDRGRIKPFHTFARENNLFLTGKYKWSGLDPVQFYLALILHPEPQNLEIINIRDVPLRKELGFDSKRRYFTAEELEKSDLENIVTPLLAKQNNNARTLEPHEKSVIEVYNQLWLLKEINSGRQWLNALNLEQLTAESFHSTSRAIDEARRYLETLSNEDQLNTVVKAQAVPALFEKQMHNMSLEVFYNKARIFFFTAVMFLIFGASFLWPPARRIITQKKWMWLCALPFISLLAGFAVRIQLTGFAPVTNMYGTMLWVSFGVALFSLVLLKLYRNFQIVGSLWLLSAALLFLTESLPLILSPDLDPIVAVLRSNLWLTIHVLTIVISYSAFSITMILGNIILVQSIITGRYDNSAIEGHVRAMYRMTQLGVFLLSVGIILGGVWADYSWGRFWGWDPKETWALIADIGFIALLHARHIGWLKPFEMALAAPLAYLLVIMAWYGVNFILAAGLHSYGFSKGGAAMVFTFVLLQVTIVVLAFALRVYRRQRPQTLG